jgi:tetratricopeptide (TPR) repeat protein
MKSLFFCAVFVSSLVFATPLPTNARATIDQGNMALVRALIDPDRPYLDHPLWKEAIAFGQMAKQMAPAHPEPYGYLGKVYSYLGWYERAWANYQSYKALGGELNHEQIAQMVALSKTLGYSLMMRGLYQEAHTYLLLGYGYTRNDPELALHLAKSYLALEKPALAQVYLRELEAREPGSEYGSLLELAQDQDKYGQAASNAFQLGVSSYYQGNLEAALQAFKQALAANPSYQKAFVWAGRTALELNRPTEALPYWQEATRLNPHDAGSSYFLTLTQNQLRWGTEAYHAYQQGLSFNEQGHTAQAETQFRQAIALNPNYSDAWAQLGYLAKDQKAYQNSAQAFAEACRLDPQNKAYQQTYQEVIQKLESPLPQAQPTATPRPAPAMVTLTTPQVMLAMATPAQQPANTFEKAAVMVDGHEVIAAVLPYLNDGPVTGGEALKLLNIQHQYQVFPSGQSAITFFSSPNIMRQDWFAPVNYANGTIYQRLEVLAKPTDELIFYQLCLVPNDDISIKPACSRASGLTLTKEGVYEFTQPLSSFYEYYNIDWSRGISSLMVIVRDKNGQTIDSISAERNGKALEAYFPMQVNYSVALVPSGGTFQGW